MDKPKTEQIIAPFQTRVSGVFNELSKFLDETGDIANKCDAGELASGDAKSKACVALADFLDSIWAIYEQKPDLFESDAATLKNKIIEIKENAETRKYLRLNSDCVG